MRKTLITINILLILAIISYITIVKYDEIKDYGTNIIEKAKGYEVIIPEYKSNNKSYEFKTVKNVTSFEPKNIEDLKNIYYTVLNNGWNEFTFYCPSEYETCIDDVKLLADNNKELAILNNYVHPYNTYLKYNTTITGNKTIYLSIEKLYSEEEIAYIEEYVDYLYENYITNNIINLNKLKFVHNTIIKKVSYDESYTEENMFSAPSKAYGAIKNGKAICSGYTDLYAIIIDRLNIPNFKVSSDDHVWNVVYFENKWHHIDVTWDDDEVNQNNTYNFFMLSTEELLQKDVEEHNFNIDYYLELK